MVQIRPTTQFMREARNEYTPVRIDENAATSVARVGAQAFRDVGEIVNEAARLAHQSNARSDNLQLENELRRIRNELENEEIPEGVDDAEQWLRDMPQRFEQRAQQAREAILRARGGRGMFQRSNVYTNYFTPVADEHISNQTGVVLERAQMRVVDWARGAEMELAAQMEARALDPDLDEETVRAPAASELHKHQMEMVRRGLITRTQAAERLASFERQRAEFLRGASEVEEALRRAAEIRQQYSTPAERLRAAEAIEDLSLRERVKDNIIQDEGRDQAAFVATTQEYLQIANTAIEANPANWTSRVPPAAMEHLRASGQMDGLRATARSILAHGADGTRESVSSEVSVARSSESIRRMFQGLIDSSEEPTVRTLLFGIPLSTPLSQEMAEELNRATDSANYRAGMVLADHMRVQDVREIEDIRRGMRTGVVQNPTDNGPMTIEQQEVARALRYAQQEGLVSSANTNEGRAERESYRSYVRRMIRDLWETDEGAQRIRPLNADDLRRITAYATRRRVVTGSLFFNNGESDPQFMGGVSPSEATNPRNLNDVPRGIVNAAIRDLTRSDDEEWNREIDRDRERVEGAGGRFDELAIAHMGERRQEMLRERLGALLHEYSQ